MEKKFEITYFLNQFTKEFAILIFDNSSKNRFALVCLHYCSVDITFSNFKNYIIAYTHSAFRPDGQIPMAGASAAQANPFDIGRGFDSSTLGPTACQ